MTRSKMRNGAITFVRNDEKYPRIYHTTPGCDFDELVLSKSKAHRKNPIPILKNSRCDFPVPAIHKIFYYGYKRSFILRRSLWIAPTHEQDIYHQIGKAIRFPRIPAGNFHVVCDGSHTDNRGGYGGAVSHNTGEVIFTLEGLSEKPINPLHHEIQSVNKILTQCITENIFHIYLFVDCKTCLRFLAEGYVITKEEKIRYGKETRDLALETRRLIRDNFSDGDGGVTVILDFFHREGTLIADHCSKAYEGNQPGFRVRRGDELSPTTKYLERRYMNSATMGFIRFKVSLESDKR